MGKKNNKGEGKDGGSNDSDNKKVKDVGSVEGKGNGKKEDKKKEGMVVVLKMDMHCEGCANKILKYAKSIDGVEKAKVEWETNKLTVLGDVDPAEIREDLHEKMKKKVELISPQLPSKDKKDKAEDGGGKKGGGDGGGDKKSSDKKGDEQKKPKELPVITAVLKVELHCGGCVEKIQRIVSRSKGVESVAFDRDKNLVMVTGRFNAGELAGVLSEKMKRSVQVVPPKKNEKDAVKDGAGGGGGGGGGEKKVDKKGGSKEEEEEEEDEDDDDYDDYDDEDEDYGYGVGGGGGFMQGRRVEYGGAGPGYGYGGYPPSPPPPQFAAPAPHYGLLYGQSLHAPQMFSDENPNACSVM